MKDFIIKNKVLLTGIISSIVLVLQGALTSGSTDYKTIGFGLLLAVLGVLSNEWKGKGITIMGIIGTVSGVFINNWQTDSFTWNEFILSTVVALLMAVLAQLSPTTEK